MKKVLVVDAGIQPIGMVAALSAMKGLEVVPYIRPPSMELPNLQCLPVRRQGSKEKARRLKQLEKQKARF